MRILLINDLYEHGGTEVQTRREKNILESEGHTVCLLTFDKHIRAVIGTKCHINIVREYNLIQKLYYNFFLDRKLMQEVLTIIKEFNPDVVHLNNIVFSPNTMYQAIEGARAVQTIRDYTHICPKGTCVYNDLKGCDGYKNSNCFKRCARLDPKLSIKRFLLSHVAVVRNRAIDVFLCPSEKLTEYCNHNNIKAINVSNSFDFSLIEGIDQGFNHEKLSSKKTYLYFGEMVEHKGIFQLLDAFLDFSKHKDVELLLAGDCKKENIKIQLGTYLNNKIKYLGKVAYDDIFGILHKTHTVVVPSLWLENYPNTILEAMAMRCLVIGSNRGGIPEMIGDQNMLFNVLDKDDIVDKLTATYEMDTEQYVEIVEKNREKIMHNNSTQKYYESLMNVFKTLQEQK